MKIIGATVGTPLSPTVIKDKLNVTTSVARNLLDNSDFTNPVNQRGQMSYSGGVYGIDRWFGNNADSVLTTTENGIIATGAYMVQILEKKHVGKALTICAKDTKGGIAVATCTVQQSTGYSWLCTNNSTNGTFVGIMQTDTGVLRANVENEAGVAIEWVALYEGEYTIDTLPEYQPKGYGVELAECQRYYRNCSKNDYIVRRGLIFSIEHYGMRVIPTCTIINPIADNHGMVVDYNTGISYPATIRSITANRTILEVDGGSNDADYMVSYELSADL